MPIWDEAGTKDFSTMIDKTIQVVFVCFINRSGSNYLLDLIEQLDLGAKPTDEALNYDQVIARCRKNGITSFASYLAKIIIANAKGGFCFLKVGGEQLFWFTKHGFISRMMALETPPEIHLYVAERQGCSSRQPLHRRNDRPLFGRKTWTAIRPRAQ